MEDNRKYLKPWQMITFGSGNAAMVLTCNFITVFMIMFCTDIMGMNSAIIGTLMLVARNFDGVSDIIFGSIMDKTKSRLGKARPWLLRSAIPLNLCAVLLFFIPSTDGWGSYAYFFLFYTVYNAVCYTMANISYNTMPALITRNNAERVNINVASYFLVMFANILINATTLGLVAKFGGTVTAWRITIGLFAALGTALLFLSGGTVKELPLEGTEETPGEPKKDGTDNKFGESINIVFSNKYYWMALGFNLFNMIGLNGAMGLLLYYCNINLENVDAYSVIGSLYLLACIPGLFLAPPLVKKFGSYKTNIYCTITTLILVVLCIPFGMSGNVTIFTLLFCLRFVPYGVICCSTAPIVPSVAEYTYRKTGKHVEGMIFSCTSVGGKLASGLTSAMTGWILAAIGYDSTLAVQSALTKSGMSIAFFGIPVVTFTLLLLIFIGLNMDKAFQKLEKEKTAQEASDRTI